MIGTLEFELEFLHLSDVPADAPCSDDFVVYVVEWILGCEIISCIFLVIKEFFFDIKDGLSRSHDLEFDRSCLIGKLLWEKVVI